ncbi:MAG: HAD-IA family hydrolase [Gemmatimonadota bacterium]
MHSSVDAVTLDFYQTLVFHRDGRGRGRVLMEYLERQGLEPAPWEHQILYDVFGHHDEAYSPHGSPEEKRAYRTALAGRVFERMGIRLASAAVGAHADALWQILGPASLEVFPDVIETLQALRARGLPLAVVSNWQSGLPHFCTELGLGSFLDHVLASGDLGVEKPDTGIFLEACERLGVPPERTLHVGDTYLDDYVGATSAGFQVVLIDRFGGAQPGDAPTIRDFTALLELVGGG